PLATSTLFPYTTLFRSHGNPLPWGRHAGRQIGGVVPGADGCRIRVKDGVSTSCRVEIKQGVERRVPRAIRPNIVENAIVEDTVTAADGHLAFPLRIPGKTDAWTKIMVLRLPHAADRIYSRSPNTGPIRGDIAPAQVSKLRDNPVNLAKFTNLGGCNIATDRACI